MELIDLLQVVRRWLWLIAAIMIVTELALWLGTKSADPVYAATVSLQISTPQREDVAAYDEYRSISMRDEITIAINNFVELLQSDEVRQRAIGQLSLEDKDSRYAIAATQVRDADFVNVTVESRTPSLAAEIANTHIGIAIAYYGELRAQSTKAEKELFAEQLRVAEQEYHAAENALAGFRAQHGIYSLESQMSTQQTLLEQLQLERDQRLLEQAATDNATPVITTPVIDLVGEVDKLIAQRQKELDQFAALAPQYNVLEQNVEQARAAYEHILDKYSEAQLKVTAVQAANFIQVIKPAYPPVGFESSWPKLAVLALAGSLGLGVVLAFLLQYFSSFKATSATVPVSDKVMPSRRKQSSRKTRSTDVEQKPIFKAASVTVPASNKKAQSPGKRVRRKTRLTDAEQEPILKAVSVTVPVSDQKTPSRGKRASRKTRSTDAKQELIAIQGQPGSTETKAA
jgi:uncharacterized protein involved in exopolysaccharide biosynthesis